MIIERAAPTVWEEAYLRFETPEEEVRKFVRRLRGVGAHTWPNDALVTELFCGRGSGVTALRALGFTRVIGVDRSLALLLNTPAVGVAGDCLRLPLRSGCVDIAVVQGGLHHLVLAGELRTVLAEIRRVLRPSGRIVAVEPWLTPFLRLAHRACESARLRRLWPKLDALATMIEHERDTYEAWLGAPADIRRLLDEHFETEVARASFGKFTYVGRKAEGLEAS